ncbi:ABC transporter substrate-binding protein [Nesterenkonia xinjiangensis]|uniref:Multiple sugar transport system substrate-binding protein n=1 Tax=Nesterenkonia xinjiangensis TaxID=225327 RepID=A0A7Z0GKS5_9MICC|nr:ABC transporter substrate-binding protein [Nesterenkonia xinjiangensis]NYJ77834.1 multiple sugar transport system substrate-binding protein [Nesterenkonia xinjiangensis]
MEFSPMPSPRSRMTGRTGRFATLAAAATVGALTLSSCGGGGDDGGDVELRFAWWGSDSRHQATQEIIDAFEEQNPDISVSAEFGDWSGYWDQLATQTAATDMPDIIQMDDAYLREYADRGALLDLDQVDTSALDQDVLENGRTEDGLIGITTGINAMVLMANPEIFEEAGVDMPDDSTWTWDDYLEITSTISENVDGVYGATGPGQPADLQIWLRQQDKHLTTDDGELGFTEDDAAEYFEHLLELMEEGGYPGASVIAEDQTPGPDESMTASGEVAMGMWWTNQLSAMSGAAGTELVPLRMPSHTGGAEDNGMWYKSTMLMSVAATTDHPEEAQQFVDFMINSEEAGEANLTDRGLPTNLDVREAVMGQIEGADLTSAEFIEDIDDEIGEPEPVPAMGFSAMQEILQRYELEVFFERQSPQDAAAQMISEMETELR